MLPRPCLVAFSVLALSSALLGQAFAPTVTLPQAADATAPIVVDVDGDGIADIAAATAVGIAVLPGLGSGDFGMPQTIAMAWPGPPSGVVAGDLDGDGSPDLVVVGGALAEAGWLRILLNDGTGALATAATHATAASPLTPTLADLDGDGDLDVIVSSVGTFSPLTPAVTELFANDGSGGLALLTTLPVSGPVDVADPDGDGDLDLLIGTASGPTTPEVRLFRNDGSGAFPTSDLLGAPIASLAGVVMTDLDGNGALDVVWVANPFAGTATFAVALGDGFGSFGPTTAIEIAQFPRDLAAADLDGDGSPELIARLFSTPSIAIFSAVAPGVAPRSQVVLSAVTTFPLTGPALADLDGDGDRDLVAGELSFLVFTGMSVHVFENLRYDDSALLGPAAAGNLPADVLFVAGESGGADRRVELDIGAGFTLEIVSPTGIPTDFALFGFIDAPHASDVTTLPFGAGTMIFPPCVVSPVDPASFLVASSLGSALGCNPGLTAGPAPWIATQEGIRALYRVTFQAVVASIPFTFATSNAVLLRVR